jgi:hypothetical protein
MVNNMKAELLVKERHTFPDGSSFAEIVIWEVPAAVEGSEHDYKYRLAFVVEEVCVVRYDNERSKGDHRYYGDIEESYCFKDIETLLADFRKDIARWQNEHG